MYEKCIHRLEMYHNKIRILYKRYFLTLLLPLTKLKEILEDVKKAIQIINLDYYTFIKRLHLYYYKKLVHLISMKKKEVC